MYNLAKKYHVLQDLEYKIFIYYCKSMHIFQCHSFKVHLSISVSLIHKKQSVTFTLIGSCKKTAVLRMQHTRLVVYQTKILLSIYTGEMTNKVADLLVTAKGQRKLTSHLEFRHNDDDTVLDSVSSYYERQNPVVSQLSVRKVQNNGRLSFNFSATHDNNTVSSVSLDTVVRGNLKTIDMNAVLDLDLIVDQSGIGPLGMTYNAHENSNGRGTRSVLRYNNEEVYVEGYNVNYKDNSALYYLTNKIYTNDIRYRIEGRYDDSKISGSCMLKHGEFNMNLTGNWENPNDNFKAAVQMATSGEDIDNLNINVEGNRARTEAEVTYGQRQYNSVVTYSWINHDFMGRAQMNGNSIENFDLRIVHKTRGKGFKTTINGGYGANCTLKLISSLKYNQNQISFDYDADMLMNGRQEQSSAKFNYRSRGNKRNITYTSLRNGTCNWTEELKFKLETPSWEGTKLDGSYTLDTKFIKFLYTLKLTNSKVRNVHRSDAELGIGYVGVFNLVSQLDFESANKNFNLELTSPHMPDEGIQRVEINLSHTGEKFNDFSSSSRWEVTVDPVDVRGNAEVALRATHTSDMSAVMNVDCSGFSSQASASGQIREHGYTGNVNIHGPGVRIIMDSNGGRASNGLWSLENTLETDFEIMRLTEFKYEYSSTYPNIFYHKLKLARNDVKYMEHMVRLTNEHAFNADLVSEFGNMEYRVQVDPDSTLNE